MTWNVPLPDSLTCLKLLCVNNLIVRATLPGNMTYKRTSQEILVNELENQCIFTKPDTVPQAVTDNPIFHLQSNSEHEFFVGYCLQYPEHLQCTSTRKQTNQ